MNEEETPNNPNAAAKANLLRAVAMIAEWKEQQAEEQQAGPPPEQ